MPEAWITITAGIVQASLATLTGHPLDLFKTRSQAGRRLGLVNHITTTFNNDGFKGFYRGFSAPLLSKLMKRPFQFYLIEKIKSQQKTSSYWMNYLLGFSIGILNAVHGTPFNILKVRLQTSSLSLKKIIISQYQELGIRGFWKGFVPNAAKESVFAMSFNGTYYTLRDTIGTDHWWKDFFNGVLAHAITWYVFIPIDFIRTQVQMTPVKTSITNIIKSNYSKHGLRVFWRGVVPACIRTVPVSGISMTGYEVVRRFLTPEE